MMEANNNVRSDGGDRKEGWSAGVGNEERSSPEVKMNQTEAKRRRQTE